MIMFAHADQAFLKVERMGCGSFSWEWVFEDVKCTRWWSGEPEEVQWGNRSHDIMHCDKHMLPIHTYCPCDKMIATPMTLSNTSAS